jgi:hypothetical protein
MVSGERDYLYLLGTTEWAIPEDGDMIHSLKRIALYRRQDYG